MKKSLISQGQNHSSITAAITLPCRFGFEMLYCRENSNTVDYRKNSYRQISLFWGKISLALGGRRLKGGWGRVTAS